MQLELSPVENAIISSSLRAVVDEGEGVRRALENAIDATVLIKQLQLLRPHWTERYPKFAAKIRSAFQFHDFGAV